MLVCSRKPRNRLRMSELAIAQYELCSLSCTKYTYKTEMRMSRVSYFDSGLRTFAKWSAYFRVYYRTRENFQTLKIQDGGRSPF